MEVTSAAGRRWDSLDALRGLAALLVVTFHCSQVAAGFVVERSPLLVSSWLDPWVWLKFTPLRLLVSSGPPAVVLFFALSGFVLSLPFLRSTARPGYAAFAIKRICRIYPPFAAAVLVSAALYWLVAPSPIPTLSPWFNTVLWDQTLSVDYVVRNLMMTGLPHDMTLDLVMWSLVHELRISLIFPLLFILTRRWPVGSAIASLMLGLGCTAFIAGHDATGIGMSLIDTARFIPMFVAGILVAMRVAAIRSVLASQPRWVMSILWIAAITLLMAPGPTITNYYDFIWGAGAVGLLVLTVGSRRAERVLSIAPLVWLGRVSYSLYLIHVPILVAMVHLCYGLMPLWIIIAGVVGQSLLAAEVMYRVAERPSIWLGRRLARAPRPVLAVGTSWSPARQTPR